MYVYEHTCASLSDCRPVDEWNGWCVCLMQADVDYGCVCMHILYGVCLGVAWGMCEENIISSYVNSTGKYPLKTK